MSKLHIFTLALDAMRFLPTQLATMNRLKCDWHWSIIEGVADCINDTKWCKRIQPRLSRDGTTEFLNSVRGHPRISVYQQQLWAGKNAMVNAAVSRIKEPCTLLQIDADELWEPWQIETISRLFDTNPDYNAARFRARYFVGPNILSVGENAYGNRVGEWLRAFRFIPGMRSVTHEPPAFSVPMVAMDKIITETMGLVVDHYPYVYPEQVAFKEEYYGYDRALEFWRRLQGYRGPWPTRLQDWLPWADSKALAVKLWT